MRTRPYQTLIYTYSTQKRIHLFVVVLHKAHWCISDTTLIDCKMAQREEWENEIPQPSLLHRLLVRNTIIVFFFLTVVGIIN